MTNDEKNQSFSERNPHSGNESGVTKQSKPASVSIVEDMEPENLKTVTIECPKCGAAIKEDAAQRHNIVCFCCGRQIRVKDRAGDNMSVFNVPDPLFLPKGSIRALVTLTMAITCWLLIIVQRQVPSYLFGLLLAIIAYYFAYRKASSEHEDCGTDSSSVSALEGKYGIGYQEKPLYLPKGFIRYFLIGGFFVAACFALSRKAFRSLQYLEFFVILAGLIAGYFFAKFTNHLKGKHSYNTINHLKGALVIAAALTSSGILLLSEPTAGTLQDASQYACLLLTCFISFYFGSK